MLKWIYIVFIVSKNRPHCITSESKKRRRLGNPPPTRGRSADDSQISWPSSIAVQPTGLSASAASLVSMPHILNRLIHSYLLRTSFARKFFAVFLCYFCGNSLIWKQDGNVIINILWWNVHTFLIPSQDGKLYFNYYTFHAHSNYK